MQYISPKLITTFLRHPSHQSKFSPDSTKFSGGRILCLKFITKKHFVLRQKYVRSWKLKKIIKCFKIKSFKISGFISYKTFIKLNAYAKAN